MINTSEYYQQTYTYDTGNNLTALSIKVILVVIFSATVAVWADGESLLPSATVCLVR
jgi:hypothetical protein